MVKLKLWGSDVEHSLFVQLNRHELKVILIAGQIRTKLGLKGSSLSEYQPHSDSPSLKQLEPVRISASFGQLKLQTARGCLNNSLIRTAQASNSLSLSEYQPYSDSPSLKQLEAVRIPASFGQLKLQTARACQNISLIRTAQAPNSSSLSEYQPHSDSPSLKQLESVRISASFGQLKLQTALVCLNTSLIQTDSFGQPKPQTAQVCLNTSLIRTAQAPNSSSLSEYQPHSDSPSLKQLESVRISASFGQLKLQTALVCLNTSLIQTDSFGQPKPQTAQVCLNTSLIRTAQASNSSSLSEYQPHSDSPSLKQLESVRIPASFGQRKLQTARVCHNLASE
ncbi:hypothetical protein EIZ39_22555 [Ammoniphilus sp. CFH 90114]|nr:hypothetical protein EIZ39_22555 [Ammoniphilus sp. CFH 90114]